MSSPWVSTSRFVMASPYFILFINQHPNLLTLFRDYTHSSPDRIMSQMNIRCPCLHTQRYIPETEKRSHIFFRASGAALFQRSTQGSRYFCNWSNSVTLSHATSEFLSPCFCTELLVEPFFWTVYVQLSQHLPLHPETC
jgi:hypothetical protein